MENLRDDILTNTEGEDTGLKVFLNGPSKMLQMSLLGVFKRYKGLICKESSKDKES